MALNARNDCPNPYAATVTTGAVTAGGTLNRGTGAVSPWIKSTFFYTQRGGTAGDMSLTLPLSADQGAIAGSTYSATVQWMVSAVPTGAMYVVIAGYDAAGTYLGNAGMVNPTPVANTVYQTVVTGVLPASTRRYGIYLYATTALASSVIYATACRLDSVNDPSLTYADGATSGWTWAGTAGNSASNSLTYIVPASDATPILTQGTSIVGPISSDSSSESESFTITTTSSKTDISTTVDSSLLVTSEISSDTSSLSEQIIIDSVTSITALDSFSLGESTNTSLVSSDIHSLSDTSSVGLFLNSTDAHSLLDSSSLLAAPSLSDTSTLSNIAEISIDGVNATGADTAILSDTSSPIKKMWDVSDTALVNEQSSLRVTTDIFEVYSLDEIFSNDSTYSTTDLATETDSSSITVIGGVSPTPRSDSAAFNESVSITVTNTAVARYGNAWDWEPSDITIGANASYAMDSGPNVSVAVTDGISYLTTANNRLAVTWGAGSSSSSQAIYLDQPTPSVIKHMTATFGFGPGADVAGASVCLASWTTPHAVTATQAQIHLSISRTGWIYYVINTLNTGGIVQLKTANFATPLVADWRRYTATVNISGNTATLNLPDGSTDSVTDSRIGSYQGTTNCFEFFRNSNAYVAPIAVYRMFAGPATGNPLGLDSANITDSSNRLVIDAVKTGTDNATTSDTANLPTRLYNVTDTASTIDVIVGTVAAQQFKSESFALSEQTSFFIDRLLTDNLTLTEQTPSIADVPNKPVSNIFTLSESVTIVTSLAVADAFTANQSSSLSAEDPTHKFISVNDSAQLTDTHVPMFNYIYTSNTFNLTDTALQGIEFLATDGFTLIDRASYSDLPRYTEDPFHYPQSYFGSDRIRVIAQDHFTREFIHWDLPIDNLQLTFTLSGPNLISGTLSTEMESLLNLNPPLTPDRTWLHVEQGDQIIASFMMTPFIDNPQSQTRSIEGEGFAAYPNWVYYEGDQYIGIQVDPADMIRKLWDHCQSYTDGNLGVKIWPTITTARIGYPNNSVQFTTKEGNEVTISGEPYNLNFWSALNCGEEIDRLCQEAPIEYWEYSQWNDFRTDVEHYIVMGYPRVGNKRTDLTFREGENLVQLIPSYQENQENYASDVFVIGAGEGPGAVRAKSSRRIGRIRKTNIMQDQNISNKNRAQSIADFELNRISQSRFLIENITIDTTHTNARWGTFIAGDDIEINGTIPYVGKIQSWYRITSYTYDPYSKVAQLNLSPSDSFSYGGTIYNPYEDLPHEGFAVLSDADFTLSDINDEDQLKAVNIKLAQQQGVEAFNKQNITSGYAYAYSQVGTTTNYVMQRLPFNQVIEPWVIIIGRTTQGFLITGANVYLVASDGTIGQAPETQAETASPTFTPGTSISLAGPFPVGLQLAAREYVNAFQSNIRISPELTYMGISANAESWRQTIGYMYYTLAHGTYNYELHAPNPLFVNLMGNVSRNTTTVL